MPRISAVTIVANLQVGETYAQARFIPWDNLTSQAIIDEKLKLRQTFSTIIKRAKEQTFNVYSYAGAHGFTEKFDLVIFGIITREPDEL